MDEDGNDLDALAVEEAAAIRLLREWLSRCEATADGVCPSCWDQLLDMVLIGGGDEDWFRREYGGRRDLRCGHCWRCADEAYVMQRRGHWEPPETIPTRFCVDCYPSALKHGLLEGDGGNGKLRPWWLRHNNNKKGRSKSNELQW